MDCQTAQEGGEVEVLEARPIALRLELLCEDREVPFVVRAEAGRNVDRSQRFVEGLGDGGLEGLVGVALAEAAAHHGGRGFHEVQREAEGELLAEAGEEGHATRSPPGSAPRFMAEV